MSTGRKSIAAAAGQASWIESLEPRTMLAATASLTRLEVQQILAAAASQAGPHQVISVVDRDGDILGIFARDKARLGPAENEHGSFSSIESILLGTVVASVNRARTVAFFESYGDAFTTRTARFIIQDHFPQPVANTPGGPLYGVEFSSLPGSDVLSSAGLSGDPGGIPLFKNGVPVGGIGVAGDGSDVLARSDLPYNPRVSSKSRVFAGQEESDFDEAVALAGAANYPAPSSIQADKIFINGLRLPYTQNTAARSKPNLSLSALINQGAGSLIMADAATIATGSVAPTFTMEGNADARTAPRPDAAPIATPASPYPTATFAGNVGTLKNTNPAVTDFGFVRGVGSEGEHLSVKDVKQIITQAVAQALVTRAGIRQPLGVAAQVHVAVTDLEGNILGVFDMTDGTVFSYDVAVQKARTAAFFSDDTHALSARAVGFMSQRFFAPGIDDSRSGPLFHLQNQLSLTPNALVAPLQNGITIFPGGLPLYKNGVLVGGLGISGDGVDQDDFITFGGQAGFRPDEDIQVDHLRSDSLVPYLTAKLDTLEDLENAAGVTALDAVIEQSKTRLKAGLDGVRIPYTKFPRNPLR